MGEMIPLRYKVAGPIKDLVKNVRTGSAWIIISRNRFHSYFRNIVAFIKRLKLSL